MRAGEEKYLLVLPRPEGACRMAQASAEKLEHTGPAKKEWPQCHKVSIKQECQTRFCQMQKKQSHQSRSPYREMGERQGEQEPHLGEKEKGKSGSMGRKVSAPQ